MSPTLLLVLQALHILGDILWVGGTLTAALVAAFAPSDGRTAVAAAARRAVLLVATPGMVLAWVAGLWMLLARWTDVYQSAGWMHAKLTLALVLSGITGFLTGRLRKAAKGKAQASPGAMRAMGIGVLVLAAGVVFLAVLQPF